VFKKAGIDLDFIFTAVLTAALTALSYFFGVQSVYFVLKPLLVRVFAALLGLTLALFGVFAALVPRLKKLHELLKMIENRFVLLILAEAAVLVFGLFGKSSLPLFLVQVALSCFSLISAFFATLYVYYLFKYAKKTERC
jgi:hypothetical protein